MVRSSALWDSALLREGRGVQVSELATARPVAVDSQSSGLSFALFRLSRRHDLFLEHQMKPVLLAAISLLLSAIAGGAAGNCLTDSSQSQFQTGTVLNNVDTVTSPGDVLLSSSSAGGANLDQQNTSFTTNGERSSNSSNSQWSGQTFTAGKSGSLSRIDLNLFCVFCSTAPPPIVVSVRATSGGLPTGSDLASATLSLTDFSGSQVWYSALFAAPATVAAGTQYAIVIRPSAALSNGTLGFSDSAVSSTIGNDVYAGGALVFSTNSGSSWAIETGPAPSVDGAFKTYISGGTSGYVSAGDLISSMKDSNPGTATTNWSTLSWTNSLPSGTSIRFQAAASNNSAGPFNFVGPDNTSGSYFTNGASLSQFNGNRYLKYRAFLATNSSTATPALNDATTCYNLVSYADLSITNTDGATTETPGTTVTYTITAANAAGGASVTGATVTDTFQQPLGNCSYTCTGANGGSCPATGIGNINASVNLPGGASVTFTETCSLAGSATGTLSNTATVTPPSTIIDSATGNNSATDTDTLTPSADLSITNSDGLTGATPGTTITYAIRAANAGPSGATGVQVADQFPSTLSCNWKCSGASGGTCAASGSGPINDASVNLPKGGNVTYTATCAIASAATGTLSTTATVTAPAGVTDPATGNNAATDSDPLTVRADAIVTMNDGITSAKVGDVVNYVIAVSNAGPSDTSATVSDALPAQLSNGSWVCSATGGASCAKASGNNNTMSTSATLPVGGVATYIYTATLMSDNSVDTFTNTVSIGTPSGTDPNGNNNTAKDVNLIVVYESDFEPDTVVAMNVASAGAAGGSYFTVQMGVDAGLLNHLGSMPVTVASGHSANGDSLFSVQLVRLGGEIAMRTVTRAGDGVASEVSPWQTGNLKQSILSLGWQSASAHGSDGRLDVSAGNVRMSAAARNVTQPVTQLQIAVENNIPWLVPIAP